MSYVREAEADRYALDVLAGLLSIPEKWSGVTVSEVAEVLRAAGRKVFSPEEEAFVPVETDSRAAEDPSSD